MDGGLREQDRWSGTGHRPQRQPFQRHHVPGIESFTGKTVDQEYAETRNRWEPLYEATQIKGDGEAHPYLSPDDEFADYETWDQGNLDLSVMKENDMLQYEYARSALKTGPEARGARSGTNPYKFGMIGSTDSAHRSGHRGRGQLLRQALRRRARARSAVDHPMAKVGDMEYAGWAMVSSGYAAVWARENTREAIFDAMMRKETYATTGPRMMVRFFGGWDFRSRRRTDRQPALARLRQAACRWVANCGEHPRADRPVPGWCTQGPASGNLDRIQIIKGWMDKKGQLHEKVYDVAWGDERTPGPDGKLPAIGSTVDVEKAIWTNTIGTTELITVWKDPDFDPKQRAFYYARVLEIPTPRWTAFDAAYFGTEAKTKIPMTTQERAYTSPIWYTP